jgi:hypothetical protein
LRPLRNSFFETWEMHPDAKLSSLKKSSYLHTYGYMNIHEKQFNVGDKFVYIFEIN